MIPRGYVPAEKSETGGIPDVYQLPFRLAMPLMNSTYPIGHVMECIGVGRIFACCDSENVASFRTMEKLGMRLVKDDGVRTNRSMGAEVRRELTYEVRF